jgi:hypothetical protein
VPDKPDKPTEKPQAPPQVENPDASPFESPTYEKVEKGINGPWEKQSDDD